MNVDVDASTTMQDVLDALSANGSGFGVAGRGATRRSTLRVASRSPIRRSVTRSCRSPRRRSRGRRHLRLWCDECRRGRSRDAAGAPVDAQVRIDGVLVSRSTNTISDALAASPSRCSTRKWDDGRRQRRARYGFGRNHSSRWRPRTMPCRLREPADGGERRASVRQRAAQHDQRSQDRLLGGVAGLNNSTYTTASMVG